MLDEKALTALATDTFSPTFLRNATAYGASPRMRFDLVVNDLSALAWTTHRIAMKSDGTPWRPLVHLRDICGAFAAVLTAPAEAVHNQVLNVGRSDANYRIREIAEAVAAVFPGCELSFGASDPDQRSYRVDFSRIREVLPAFTCEWDLHRGIVDLRAFYERAGLTEDLHRFRAFTRMKQLRHLLETDQIDDNFFWVGV